MSARIELRAMTTPTTVNMDTRANIDHAIDDTLNHVDAAQSRLIGGNAARFAAISIAAIVRLLNLEYLAARFACGCGHWRGMGGVIARSAAIEARSLEVKAELFVAMGAKCETRGIIGHSEVSLLDFAHVRGCFQHRSDTFIGELHYSIKREV